MKFIVKVGRTMSLLCLENGEKISTVDERWKYIINIAKQRKTVEI